MITDADGREWVLVPVEATDEMALAMVNAPISGHPETGSPTVTDMWVEAIAAAPQFVPPAVADQTCVDVVYALVSGENSSRKEGAAIGEEMIAAVQQVLGPTLGLAPQSIDVDWLHSLIRQEPDARLIAAAPELVEALRTARDYVFCELETERQQMKGYERISRIDEIAADLAEIDAALAKAGVL